MSDERKKAFSEKLKSDQEFAKKIAETEKEIREAGKGEEDFAKAVEALAKENGVDIAAEDVLELLKPAEGEITDSDLDGVSGGSRAEEWASIFSQWSKILGQW